MDSEKVVLGKDEFKALASDTRISILKLLKKRRMTQSELAKELGVSVQSVSEHVEKLASAGLVSKVESARKWVYFDLTEKGHSLLNPERKNFWILLSISLFAIMMGSLNKLGSIFYPENYFAPITKFATYGLSGRVATMGYGALGSAEAVAAKSADALAVPAASSAASAPEIIQASFASRAVILTPGDIAVLVVGSVLFAAAVYYLFRHRKKLFLGVLAIFFALMAFLFVFF